MEENGQFFTDIKPVFIIYNLCLSSFLNIRVTDPD